jgi:carboxypeptidase PM20D1
MKFPSISVPERAGYLLGVGCATLVLGSLSIAVLRAYLAGRVSPAAEEGSAPHPVLAGAAAYFESSQAAIAGRLSEALQLRTVSYETEGGHAASLLPAGPEGSPPAARAPKGGCMCCKEALGGAAAPSEQPALGTLPTPEALDESRAAFLAFHALLERSFPRLHAALERHVVNTYSLLYLWRPAPGSPASPGISLCAHMDVVPVPDAGEWQHPPFAGTVAGGYVHGRGAIDDKHSLLCICEAVEYLLGAGWAPTRPIVLCFGHDEELGGMDGAAHFPPLIQRLIPLPPTPAGGGASAATAAAPKPLLWSLDEGLFLLSDFMPGLTSRVAMVCTAEKGHLNVQLTASAPASHSSIPPPSSSIGALARAIAALEASPYPPRLHPAMATFTALLPAMPFSARLLFANQWLFAPVLTALLLAQPATAAMLRTTTAVTIARAGVKSNVMPPSATAIVNRRLHPGDSVAGVLARDRGVLARVGCGAVAVSALEPLEPSPLSSSAPSAPGWAAIGAALRGSFSPPPLQAPGLMLGNTDTRHFWGVAQDIYRHCPTELTLQETAMFHGKNERVAVANLARLCRFYAGVLVAGAGGGEGGKA